MKDFFYLNPEEMIKLSRTLKGAEIKMLLAMMYCMSINDGSVFINNAENRALMGEIDFAKTPERISTLLSSLTKKGVIKREVNGVYSLPAGLFQLSIE